MCCFMCCDPCRKMLESEGLTLAQGITKYPKWYNHCNTQDKIHKEHFFSTPINKGVCST